MDTFILRSERCRVSRWGKSLAVRLPAAVIDELGLKEGDEIEIGVDSARRFSLRRKPDPQALLAQLRAFRGWVPADFRFDGKEASERGMSARFFDTNVLVYLASADPRKADIAERLLAEAGRSACRC